MKITLNIDDTVMAELKREAARQGRTMSELVESALRLLLRSHRKQEKLSPLPTFHSGGALVDIADRDALYQAMEGPLVLAVDTNVLLERQRARPDAW
jgi:Ribbon-helix-helix protein, copG family